MDRIKKGLGRISIPAAFILCGIGCLLAALALTKVTVSTAKRNMTEIVSKYDAFHGDVFFVDSAPFLSSSEEDDLEGKAGVTVVGGGEAEVHVAKIVPLDGPDQKKIDFYAHMDEIAYMVKVDVKVDDNSHDDDDKDYYDDEIKGADDIQGGDDDASDTDSSDDDVSI